MLQPEWFLGHGGLKRDFDPARRGSPFYRHAVGPLAMPAPNQRLERP